MITQKQKEYCVHNLAAMVLNKICQSNKGLSYSEAAESFFSSLTYAALINPKTYLWAEGPDYILGLFEEENLNK